jgi:DUF971 family protein
MKATELQVIGNELAVKWEDGSESFIILEKLRRACPCAGCKGETDVMGNLHKGPDSAYSARSFELARVGKVGSYAIQPVWRDGHSTGIYPFDLLLRLTKLG